MGIGRRRGESLGVLRKDAMLEDRIGFECLSLLNV